MRRAYDAVLIGIGLAVITAACAKDDEVQVIPISFEVKNVNTSAFKCDSDGKTYTLRGHLVAPVGFDRSKNQDAVTLYVHAVTTGEFLFLDQDSPEFSTVQLMAKRGHVSVVYDRLGFGASDHPIGTLTCMGAQADMAKQIADQLRNGSYQIDGGSGRPQFARVALFGLSGGAVITNVAASSFDAFDALVDVSAVVEYKQEVIDTVAKYFVPICTTGGEPVEDDGTGVKGYSYFAPKEAFVNLIYDDPDPAQAARVLTLLNRDPCGDLLSFPGAVMAEAAGVANIHKPVLLVTGQDDKLFATQAGSHFATAYTGTTDFKFVELPGCGHEPARERGASAAYFDTIDGWLAEHSF